MAILRSKRNKPSYSDSSSEYSNLVDSSSDSSSNISNNSESQDDESNISYKKAKYTYECNNPLCDHKDTKKSLKKVPKANITKVESIHDLLTLGKSYHCKRRTEYNAIDLRILCNLVPSLTNLSNMIGFTDPKNQIVDQIMYFLHGFHSSKCNKCIECIYGVACSKKQDDMMHTVITGVPGIGKTQFGKILAEIYREMGFLSNSTFKIATRADLIGEYMGKTAIKTQKVIDSVYGGVLFIDEAYSLASSEKIDSYSKECIDTINQNLTERRDFVCIIAGYKNALDECFFRVNEGLRRRFTFRYDLKPYTWQELYQIFELKVKDGEWDIDSKSKDAITKLFECNGKYFINYGGDMETLFLKAKIAHSRQCNLDQDNKRYLDINDIDMGIKQLIQDRDIKKDISYPHMYI